MIRGRTAKRPIPDLDEILGHILCTPDSAAGIDGIPYGFWRVAPLVTAWLIQQIFYFAAVNPGRIWDSFGPMHQLLIFIPKIPNAIRAADMRPLALPTTFLRMMSALIFRSLDRSLGPMMCPEQSLVGPVREAHVMCEKNAVFHGHWAGIPEQPLTISSPNQSMSG